VERLGWEPSISLRDGLERTYAWIYDEMSARIPIGSPPAV
jgi:GDP-D-mannose 3',5'-epimerase